MKIFLLTLAALAALLVIAGIAIYAIGARLPVNHTATVTGIVAAPPARVFALVTNIADAPKWRKEVQSVQVLPPEQERDRWVEDLGHNQKMPFLALRSDPPNSAGVALREVRLNDETAAYGGTWTYKLEPGPAAGTTLLQITETGFIKPPFYRFMMAYVFGMTKNLDQYMHNIQAAGRFC